MTVTRPVPLAVATIGGLMLAASASAQLVDAGDVDVRFLAVGPAGLTINGQGSDLHAKDDGKRLEIDASVTDLKTGIGLRDEHLKKYIQADQYPKAKLVVDRSSLTFPSDGKDTTGTATGQLTLHGVTKPLKFSYKARRTGSDFHVQGLAAIDIRNYGIETPCYLKVCVEPDVKLKVKFKLRDK